MDTAIGGDGQGQPKERFGLFTDQPSMSNPTLVLLRIENNGTNSIAETDYTNPDKNHGLSVVFAERTVESIEVSRDANSGTRDLLRRRILGGAGEGAFTSRDCVNKNTPQDTIIRCELGSTDEVLRTVTQVPGAIGYSELGVAVTTKGLHTLNIDGQRPSIKAIGDDTYRFTEIEYAYTNGAPPP